MKWGRFMYTDHAEYFLDQLNPTFLFTWKGTRFTNEDNYHSHDFIEMAATIGLMTASMKFLKAI